MEKGVNKKKHLQAKSILLTIAIALISVFFVAYAIQSFYSEPEYKDYCKSQLEFTKFNSSSECESIGGKWEEDNLCNENFTCMQEYWLVRDIYERNIFFINLVIGLALLLTGFFINKKAIGSGLMAGGVIMIFYGIVRNWGNLSNILKTVLLGITLAILITLAYKKLKD